MVSKRLVVGLAAVLSVFGAACAASSKDGPDPAPAPDPRPADEDSADAAAPAAVTVDQYCAAFCKKVHACDASQGVSSCESTCTAANKTAIPKLRPEVATSMMSCIADSSCSDVESNAAPKDCFDTELASAKADAAAKKACSALESASSTCGVAFDLSTCLEEAAVYTDATAASVGACADRICGSVESCLQAVAPLSFGYSASASCAVVAPGQTFHSSNAQCNSCVGSSCCATASACDANADCT
ncbi:MAG TPA: hypothetical protein VIF62_25680, partial [Labilithrix sp.]